MTAPAAPTQETVAEIAARLFPGEQTTQRYAAQAIEVLQQAGLDEVVPLTTEAIGALVQTFARGDDEAQLEQFQRDILFHFTYQRQIANLESDDLGVIRNPNAVDEINAVTGGIDGGFTFELADPNLAGGIGDVTPGEITGRIEEETAEGALDVIATGILGGGQLFRIQRDARDDQYIQVYRLPGTTKFAYYQFDPLDSDSNGVPDEVQRTFGPSLPSVTVMSEAAFDSRDNSTFFFAGTAVDNVIGVQGTFAQLYDDVQRQALAAAGITDPGLQGQILASPEVQDILSAAALIGADVSGPQIQAQIRATDFYQNELYPGVKFFLDRGDADPAQSWRNYQQQTEPLFRSLGFARDEDGTFRSSIGDFLGAGVDADELRTFAPVLKQIQENPDLKPIMDEWAQRELGRTLDFNEFLDVLEGTTDPELNRVVEAATLAHSAERAGIAVNVDDIRRIADATDLSPEQALNAFTQAERALLAAGPADLERFGISQGDFLDLAAGVNPRSGLSAAAVSNLATKLAAEQGLVDDPSARFFTRLNERGTLQTSGQREVLRG